MDCKICPFSISLLMVHKSSLWVSTKNWARSVQPFWRLLNAHKHTNKQIIHIHMF